MSFARQTYPRMITAAAFAALALVFAVTATPAQTQTFKLLWNAPGNPGPSFLGGMTLARDGNFYGSSYNGGQFNNGSIFRITPAGVATVIYSNPTSSADCYYNPNVLGADGTLYGSGSGCYMHDGYLFKITTGGKFTLLHTFSSATDGSNPTLTFQGTNGNFYGITNAGGTLGGGTVFEMTPSGTVTTLASFGEQTNFRNPGGLVQGGDGNFYGVLYSGGPGAFFRLTPKGVVTFLYQFQNSPDGANPSGLVQGTDGDFYGVTQNGGANGVGTIYKITASGKETKLHDVNVNTDQGEYPTSNLIEGSDGNFYGTMVSCSAFGCTFPENVYEITPNGAYTVMFSFPSNKADGVGPYPGVLQDPNGTLFGLANQGGPTGDGTFYSVNHKLKAFISLSPTSGNVGSKIGILGQGFSSTSVVEFNGVKATTVQRTGTKFLLATVPVGASDGMVTVTTGKTALSSLQTFIVHDSWGSGAVLPTALQGAATGVIGGKVYVVGGATNSAIVAINQIYNPKTNKWITGAPMPTARFAAAGAVVGNTLYVIGGNPNGSSQLNVVEAYDAATNTWSTKSPMPTARDSIAAVVEGGIIYVIGGYDNTNRRLATVESYDPATDTWAEEASLLVAKSEAGVGLLGSTIVAAGGLTNSGTVTGDTEGYNAKGNAWTTLTADPTPRQAGCAASISGHLYFAGGTNGTPLNVVESFSATANKWTALTALPQAVVGPGAATVNGLLYCFGGSNNGGLFQGTVYNYLQIYQP